MRLSDYIFMVIYLAVVIIIGVAFTKKETTTTGYLLGGGKIPWWAIAISYMMALVSTVSLVATPGEAYNNGLRLYTLELFAPIPAILCFHIFMRFYFATKTFTPFTYIENRFDVRIRVIVSTIYFFTRLTYLALVLFSCSMVFKGMIGLDPRFTILLIGITSAIYCTFGGLKAVVWTNVMQFGVLVGGLIAVIVVCIKNVNGGIIGIFDYAFSHGRGFNVENLESDFFSFDPHVRATLWLLIFASSVSYLTYNTSDQLSIQQLLSTKSYKQARKSYLTSILTFIPLGWMLWFIGLSVFCYFSQNPLPEGNPPGDIALFKFITLKMPSPMPGLMASGMLAAAISTISAGITGFATIATKDFYLRFFRPSASEMAQVKFSRIMVFSIGIIATILGLLMYLSSSITGETVIEASAMWIAISAVVAPTFLVGVLNKRCNSNQIFSAICIGWVMTICMVVWYIVGKKTGNPISFLLIQVPGMLTMIAYGMIIPSIFRNPPSAEKIKNLTYWNFDKSRLE